MGVELRHLRYFVAVVNRGGFTAAAREVHVSQQVLSAQIRQLEQMLGALLLDRTSRGVQLTAAGSTFYAGAQETLRRLDQAVASVERQESHTLAVGLSVAAGGAVPSALIAHYERVKPRVRVQLRTWELDQPAAGLLSGASDVAFVRPPVAAPGIGLRTVGTEGRVVVLPLGHRLASAETISLEEIRDDPWVAAPPAVDGCQPSAWRDDWLAVPRVDGRTPVIGAVATSIDEWREHVAAGRGVSVCPASAELYYARPDLSFVPAADAAPALLCVAWRTEDPNPLVPEFLSLISDGAAATG